MAIGAISFFDRWPDSHVAPEAHGPPPGQEFTQIGRAGARRRICLRCDPRQRLPSSIQRNKTDSVEDIGAEAADPTPSIESVLNDADDEGRCAVRAAFEACVKGDDKLESLYLAIIDGNLKREEIAAALGWTPDEVSAARNKLQRRLVAQFPALFASYKKTRVRT